MMSTAFSVYNGFAFFFHVCVVKAIIKPYICSGRCLRFIIASTNTSDITEPLSPLCPPELMMLNYARMAPDVMVIKSGALI